MLSRTDARFKFAPHPEQRTVLRGVSACAAKKCQNLKFGTATFTRTNAPRLFVFVALVPAYGVLLRILSLGSQARSSLPLLPSLAGRKASCGTSTY